MENVIQIYIDRLAQANHKCVLLEARVEELEARVKELEETKSDDEEDIDNVQDK